MSSPRARPEIVPLLRPVPEAAAILSVSEKKVWDLINDGILETVLIGRSRRVTQSSLERLAAGPPADPTVHRPQIQQMIDGKKAKRATRRAQTRVRKKDPTPDDGPNR
jgi:hypothetical protein